MSAENRQTGNIVFGFHAVEAIINRNPAQILEIQIDRGKSGQRIDTVRALAMKSGIPIRLQGRQELNQLACQGNHPGNHQGVIALIGRVDTTPDRTLEEIIARQTEHSLILVLDQIQDPHNLGACLRTAECAGVDAVILPRDGACRINQTVHKVSSGAVGHLDIFHVPNLVNTLDKLQNSGFWVYGATDKGAVSLYQCEYTGKVVVVMGAEGKGLRRLTREKCDYLVNIPMSGNVSSLNVSVATGIFLFEVIRQRC